MHGGRSRRAVNDLYSADVEWLLTEAAAALGARSNLAGQVATIMNGGAHGMPSDLPQAAGSIDARQCRRHARLWAAWKSVTAIVPHGSSPDTTEGAACPPWWADRGRHPHRVLIARYCLRMPERANGTVIRVQKYTTTKRLKTTKDVEDATELVRHPWLTFPAGVEAIFGEVAGVAILLANDAGALKRTLGQAHRGQELVLRDLRIRAEQATKQAHRAFSLARREVAEQWLTGT